MTQDFFLGQLRLIVVAFIAFASGKGWLSSADSTFIGAILPPVGLLIGPWAWSIYSNWSKKFVPAHTVVIDPVFNPANVTLPTATIETKEGKMTGKVIS